MPPGTYASCAGLYNGMISPLTKYPIRGAIWYQGESNAAAAVKYRTVFPALIKDWRAKWNQPEMPFLFVQLANFMPRQDQPGESAWAELREAQLMTLALPHTGMAVTIDIGDADDIHPKNKQDAGKRLELAALAQAYGKKLVYSGPIYKSMKVEGDKVRLSFDHVGGGLAMMPDKMLQSAIEESRSAIVRLEEKSKTFVAHPSRLAEDIEKLKKRLQELEKVETKLVGFAIAGEDRKFVWAEAKIEGNEVIVWSDKVAKPLAVRYAWADNPECNLYNKSSTRKPSTTQNLSGGKNGEATAKNEGYYLPASPFRTDNWDTLPTQGLVK